MVISYKSFNTNGRQVKSLYSQFYESRNLLCCKLIFTEFIISGIVKCIVLWTSTPKGTQTINIRTRGFWFPDIRKSNYDQRVPVCSRQSLKPKCGSSTELSSSTKTFLEGCVVYMGRESRLKWTTE